MKQSSQKHTYTPLQLFLFAVAALALSATILHTVALLAFQDAVGYFRTSLPVIALYIIEGSVLALCIVFPFVKKGTSVSASRPLSTAGLVGAASGAVFLVVNALYLFLRREVITYCPALLVLLTAIFCALGAGYFATRFRGSSDSTVLCGYGMILCATCMLVMTYFDRYTQMNAPHKISLHLCMLAVMLAVLFEVRELLHKDLSPWRLATTALAFFFCVMTGLGNVIAFLAGVYNDLTYLFQDLICLSLSVYFGARLFDLVARQETQVKEQ